MESSTHYLLLSKVKRLVGTENDEAVTNDDLRDLIYEVSRIIDGATARRFDRFIETRIFDACPVSRGGAVDGDVLILNEDCQSLITVTVDGVAVDNSSLSLLPRNFKSYAGLVRRTDDGSWYSAADNRDAIVVTAVWGYGGRWLDKGLTLDGGITDSTTSLALTGTPVPEQEHVLKVGDEYMRVVTDPVDNSAVTVERGYNGSTAAAHSDSAAVLLFEADARVRRATKRYLQWLKSLEKNPLFGTVTLGDMEMPVDVAQFPKDLKKIIADLERKGL